MILKIIDTTLRDGEQEINISFSRREKEQIVETLLASGITHIEAGIPVSGDRSFIRSLNGRGLTAICWCRAVEADIITALTCRTGAIHISFPLSVILQEYTGWTAEKLLGQTKQLISRYKGQCGYLSVGAMDSFRADPTLLKIFTETALTAGADMVRLADTPGFALPEEVRAVFRHLKGMESQLEFHGHNDLGMAAANAITAADCGAGGISGTLYGIGERAGNAPLEEVLLALKLKYKHLLPEDLDLQIVTHAAKMVAQIAGENIPPRKPVCGANVFSHESGIHVKGMMRNPETFQSYPPEMVGAATEFRLGSSSGSSAIMDALKHIGTTYDETKIPELLESVRQRSACEKRSFQFWEIRNFL